ADPAGADQRVQHDRDAQLLHGAPPGAAGVRPHRRRQRVPDLPRDRAAAVQGGPRSDRPLLRRRVLELVLQRAAVHQRHHQVADPAGAEPIRRAGQRDERPAGPGPARPARTDRADGDRRGRHRADPHRLPLRSALLHQGRAHGGEQGLTPRAARPATDRSAPAARTFDAADESACTMTDILLSQSTTAAIPGEQQYVDPDLAAAARALAAQGTILLHNNGLLPLDDGRRIALFGRTQKDWIAVGYGSGGDVNAPYVTNLLD